MKTKTILSYFLLFIFVITAELLLLAGAFALPKNMIRENVMASAEFLCENTPFFHLSDNDLSSRIDRHADAILLNIAWSADPSKPLSAALYGAYYYDEIKNENDNLLTAVTLEKEPTYEYMRYWHGSLIFTRPLLVLFSLKQIYVLGAIALFLLFFNAFFCIRRRLGKGTAYGLLLAGFSCSIWYVPFSLEYMPAFLITFTSVPVLFHVADKKPQYLGHMFLILGSLTAYTDFLTVETLSCLLPICLLLLTKPGYAFSEQLKYGMRHILIWAFGYIGTWSGKWILYSIFIKNAFSEVISQTIYRTGGKALSGGLISQIIGALLRNIRCLFPFSLLKDPEGMIVATITVILTGMIFYLLKRRTHMPPAVPVLALAALIPYVRYCILSNHSFLHYFFTYRAQFVSVFCIYMMFLLGMDYDFLKKEWKKISKKKR